MAANPPRGNEAFLLTPHLPNKWLHTLKIHTKKNEDLILRTKLGKIRRDLDYYNFHRVFNLKKLRVTPNPPLPQGYTTPMALMAGQPNSRVREIGPTHRPTAPRSSVSITQHNSAPVKFSPIGRGNKLCPPPKNVPNPAPKKDSKKDQANFSLSKK